MKDCPTCGAHVDGLFCPKCGDGTPAPEARSWRTSYSLTERQWYVVCKYFPNVARRCKRPFADVRPDNPLEKEIVLGPLMRHFRPLEPTPMREPGEEG